MPLKRCAIGDSVLARPNFIAARSRQVLTIALLGACLLIFPGCAGEPPVPPPTTMNMFAPAGMRIHPIFTQIKDWAGAGVPTGVEVLLEFQDQFGDPCKASGRVIFQIYQFQKFSQQRRGNRLVNPYVGDLTALQAQRDRWNRTSRTYTFQLFNYGMSADQNYLLTAEFQGDDGRRFFDQIVLEAQPPPTTLPTLPTTNPTTQPAS
jgi:hypothetical protein